MGGSKEYAARIALTLASPQQLVRGRQWHIVAKKKLTERPVTVVGSEGWQRTTFPVLSCIFIRRSFGTDTDASEVGRSFLLVRYGDLDIPIDLTGHILSPFYQRELMYQDCTFQSIAHLLCYRYAIINNQKTFATGIRKWSRILVDFPIPKFKSTTETQQWVEILTDIYTYLCDTDETIRSALVETGPRPFTLDCRSPCRSPWGRDTQHPDTAPKAAL